MEKTCPVCGGALGKQDKEICCSDEDKYLLIKCKGHMREFEDRKCGIDEVVELLYDDLDELLKSQGRDLSEYDADGVLSELDRRVLRWISKDMIDFHMMRGIGFCTSCGSPIMAGRTKCSNCIGKSQFDNMKKEFSTMNTSNKPARMGMHTKKR